MLGITDPVTYLAGVVVVVLLPGPNSLFVLSVAARRGVRAGFSGAAGVVMGDLVLMSCAALGATSLLKANPTVFSVLKYAGAAYLAWLGIQMLRAAWSAVRALPGPLAAPPSRLQGDAGKPWLKALTISLMNPKAILFFFSFFVQFVDPAYPMPGLTFAALGLMLQCCSFLYLTTLVLAGTRLATAFGRRRRLSAALTGGVGTLFIGFGAKLAMASLG
ncbi:leucine efflux protein LeuE [Paludibacterium paludis]|uniref:Leucine efflux protein n=1 Tax=Paludibacterium paludis TaxID=1225769 RepID=A0A918U880_9NEIS|nr:leucine efflux protein LeuE [Paludibacterium paludis]GGY08074.1 leucine efflux protein [Paludibacterium paludis]